MELAEAYGLEVARVPPHRPSRRVDHPNQAYFFRQVGSKEKPMQWLNFLMFLLKWGRPECGCSPTLHPA